MSEIDPETWTPPRCSHGHILLGCPMRDCEEQNVYLAQQDAQIKAWQQRQQKEARDVVRSMLGLPRD